MSQSSDEFVFPPDPTKAADTSHQPTIISGSRLPQRKVLGERLRMARYAARLTQQELAGASFSKSYLSAVERGKMMPSLSALRLLASRLGVSLAYLLGEENLPLSAQTQSGASPAQERSQNEEQLARRLDEAEQLLALGNPDAALERLSSLNREADPSITHRVRWNWLHGWALLQQHREQEAVAVLERGLEAVPTSDDHRSISHLYFTLANANAAQHKDTSAEQALQEALRLAEQISDHTLLGCIHEKYGVFLSERGRYQEAYEHMRRAAEEATHACTNGSPIGKAKNGKG